MKKIFFWENTIYKEDAYISINSPIVHFGISLYETLLVKDSVPIFFDQHFERLFQAIQYLKVKVNKKQLYQIVFEKVHKLLHFQYFSTQQARLKIVFIPKDITAQNLKLKDFSHFIVLSELENVKQHYTYYISNILKNSSNSIPFYVKLSSNLRNILATKEAHENNCDEGLLFNSMGYLCEGSFSNVFIVKSDNKVITPHLRNNLLSGVTRDKVITILQDNNYLVEETDITLNEITKAKEIFLTSATRGISCVSKITIAKEALKTLHSQNLKRVYNFPLEGTISNIQNLYQDHIQQYAQNYQKKWELYTK